MSSSTDSKWWAVIVGQDLLATTAESTWAPLGADGLGFRTAALERPDDAGGWPDRVFADVDAADPAAALVSLGAIPEAPDPILDTGQRAEITQRIPPTLG